MEERANVLPREQEKLYKSALKKGLHLGKAIDKNYDFRVINYFESRENKKTIIHIYKGLAFLHSRNKKTLYTVYEIPDDIKEIIERSENKE